MKKIYSKPELDAIDLTMESFCNVVSGEDGPGGGSKKIRRDFFETDYEEEEFE